MTDITSTDAWCDLIELALTDDSPTTWAEAAGWTPEEHPTAGDHADDVDEQIRQARRLAELIDRVRAQQDATRGELDELVEERRQLLLHARALTRYATSETGPPVDRLLRMMLVG